MILEEKSKMRKTNEFIAPLNRLTFNSPHSICMRNNKET